MAAAAVRESEAGEDRAPVAQLLRALRMEDGDLKERNRDPGLHR